MNTPTSIADQVRQIADLRAFSAKSRIPYRTLFRIKHVQGHKVSVSTGLAIEGAIKRYKPAMRAAEAAQP